MIKIIFYISVFLCFSVLSFSADGVIYKDAIVVTTLYKVKGDGGTEYLRLKLPFEIYGYNIICRNKDITMSLNDLSLEGEEVMAKIDYRIEDEEKVKSFAGFLGDKPKLNPLFLKYKKDGLEFCESIVMK